MTGLLPPRRINDPTVSSAVATITTGAEPQIMLARWATGAKIPMQSTGRSVRTPSQALLSWSSASICGTSGGTPARAGRRFAATATSATTRTHAGGSHGNDVVVGGAGVRWVGAGVPGVAAVAGVVGVVG